MNLPNLALAGLAYVIGLFGADSGEDVDDQPPARPKQLTVLTDELLDQMRAFAARRIEYGRRTGRLTDDDWAVWEAGARRCYEATGVPWPGVVVKVPSPLVGALAPLIAERVIRQPREGKSLDAEVRSAVTRATRSVLGPSDTSHVDAALCEAVLAVIDASPSGGIRPLPDVIPASGIAQEVISVITRKVFMACFYEVFEIVLAGVPNIDSALTTPLYSAVRTVASTKKWRLPLPGRSSGDYGLIYEYFRDIVRLELDPETWKTSQTIDDVQSAGCWWPFLEFAVVCDLPTELHIETINGTTRLHNADGPAVRWADGWGLYAWHGTGVPADLIETCWDVERIMRERNVEVRRCAIEHVGWDRFVAAAGFKLVDEAPDPANPGQTLRLFKMPRSVLGTRAHVLMCINATVERDGARRTFALPVPTTCRTALAAAAWTFDVSDQEYSRLARAT